MGPSGVPRYAALIRALMQPAPQQMVGDRKGMRSGEAVGMLPLDHQRRLGAVEPAGIFQFRVVDDDVLIGGARGASDHQG